MLSNRDEFHQRPTVNSQFWPEHPNVLAGIGLEAGGSWMGVNRDGHFTAITNVRHMVLNLQANAPIANDVPANHD